MRSYWNLFWTFVKVSAFTIGGGMAMVAVVRDILVVKRKWMSEDEFMDILAISQTLPGLMAVNTAIFVGYRLMGTKGSIVATLGSILPPFTRSRSFSFIAFEFSSIGLPPYKFYP